jgi:transposase InsO family protein
MSQPLHPLALFRLSVLGQLASRGELQRGEIKAFAEELSKQAYNIPGSRRVHLSVQTILRWYYAWKRSGIDGLTPKSRLDKGKSQLPESIRLRLLEYKNANTSRSINTLISLLEKQGIVPKGELSRSTVHRFLKANQASKRIKENQHRIERRAFEAEHAGDIWYGDVLHGPFIQTVQGMKKTYLVSLMDDASRLIVHSQFCFSEKAVEIEDVLKQAILKRGLPRKLVVDNGAAYKTASLQAICARLDIRLIHCLPYEPEGKGKLERFHRTFREQFLAEVDVNKMRNICDLNQRVMAWLDQHYHQQPHAGLKGKTPIERWREDLIHVTSLGLKAEKIDDIFYHRVKRTVRKDGTVCGEGQYYETDYRFVEKEVQLVIDPHERKVLKIESINGDDYGAAVLLDKHRNLSRKRCRPEAPEKMDTLMLKPGTNNVELSLNHYEKRYALPKEKK